jgi:hypothetical protein
VPMGLKTARTIRWMMNCVLTEFRCLIFDWTW